MPLVIILRRRRLRPPHQDVRRVQRHAVAAHGMATLRRRRLRCRKLAEEGGRRGRVLGRWWRRRRRCCCCCWRCWWCWRVPQHLRGRVGHHPQVGVWRQRVRGGKVMLFFDSTLSALITHLFTTTLTPESRIQRLAQQLGRRRRHHRVALRLQREVVRRHRSRKRLRVVVLPPLGLLQGRQTPVVPSLLVLQLLSLLMLQLDSILGHRHRSCLSTTTATLSSRLRLRLAVLGASCARVVRQDRRRAARRGACGLVERAVRQRGGERQLLVVGPRCGPGGRGRRRPSARRRGRARVGPKVSLEDVWAVERPPACRACQPLELVCLSVL